MTPDDVDPKDLLRQVQETRADLEHRLHILAEGERSGFRTYLWAFLEPMAQVASQKLLTEKDVYELVRLQARAQMLQQILSWPEREMRGIRERLGQASEPKDP
jgi:hypothetical protein